MKKHFCVSVFVFSKENRKFLLIDHKKLGKWVQPGGHVEENEDPEEAALREVYEETGIKVKLIGERVPFDSDYICPLAIQKHEVEENHIHIDIIYVAHPIDNDSLKMNENETNGIGWFSLEEILSDDFNTFDDVKSMCRKIQSDMIK